MSNINKRKTLSLIMPFYNSERFIKQSISSLLNQSFDNFNLFLINDGSTDNSIELIQSIKDKRFILLNKEHSGIIDSFNYGLNFVDTPFLARVDSDDIYLRDKFNKQITFLESSNSIDAVGTGIKYISENNRIFPKSIIPPKEHNEIINNLFNLAPSLYNPTIVYRNYNICEFKLQDGFYPEDLNFFLKYGTTHKFSNIPEVLTNIRITKNGYSSQNYNELISNFITKRNEYLKFDCYSDLVIKEINIKEFEIKRELLSAYLNSSFIKLPVNILKAIKTNPKIFINLFKKLI
ncbi:MAG: glycosyltransferase family 2 protein [Melioribacteraceae bacterium]|nr:glycosyltransferase family 2 protein [Melioribacteraceae bacterium]